MKTQVIEAPAQAPAGYRLIVVPVPFKKSIMLYWPVGMTKEEVEYGMTALGTYISLEADAIEAGRGRPVAVAEELPFHCPEEGCEFQSKTRAGLSSHGLKHSREAREALVEEKAEGVLAVVEFQPFPGGRLRYAIKRRPRHEGTKRRGIRQFIRDLDDYCLVTQADRGVKIINPTPWLLYCYFRGEKPIPNGFLRVAAHLIGARLEWLKDGTGEIWSNETGPTEPAQYRERAAEIIEQRKRALELRQGSTYAPTGPAKTQEPEKS